MASPAALINSVASVHREPTRDDCGIFSGTRPPDEQCIDQAEEKNNYYTCVRLHVTLTRMVGVLNVVNIENKSSVAQCLSVRDYVSKMDLFFNVREICCSIHIHGY